mmetsp:Transcript_43704/g.129360  ORF Transcript_43704/g.129360 Transcript_43704/m.129360 type:complete len:214 (+) Transcript_43704:598-1239(+)
MTTWSTVSDEIQPSIRTASSGWFPTRSTRTRLPRVSTTCTRVPTGSVPTSGVLKPSPSRMMVLMYTRDQLPEEEQSLVYRATSPAEADEFSFMLQSQSGEGSLSGSLGFIAEMRFAMLRMRSCVSCSASIRTAIFFRTISESDWPPSGETASSLFVSKALLLCSPQLRRSDRVSSWGSWKSWPAMAATPASSFASVLAVVFSIDARRPSMSRL